MVDDLHSLQPSNASPWRRAVSLVNAERRPIDTSLLASIMDPWHCSADLLPWLAWGFSVDIWDETWPDVKKRAVIAHSIQLHRLKTTPAGIKAHVALTGSTVTRIIRPPARPYYRAAMTESQRIAWLNHLPQIRIRPFALKQTAVGRWFWKGRFARFFCGAVYGRVSRGPLIYGRTASLYINGDEIPARLDLITPPGQEPFEQVRIIGSASPARRFWSNGFLRSLFLLPSAADAQVLSVRLSDTGMMTSVPSGLRPVDIRPQRIAEKRHVPKGKAFLKTKVIMRRFWTGSVAARFLYERISLHFGEKTETGGRAVSYWGRCRFGIKPYTAEIKIAVPMKRHPRAARLFHTGHLKKTDMAPFYSAISAVSLSKAFRDRVLIDTTIHRTIRLSDRPVLGDFKPGQLKRI